MPGTGGETIRRIAVNTGGGDAPGLNGVIRAVVVSARRHGWECIGVRDGYNGIFLPEQYPDPLVQLTEERVQPEVDPLDEDERPGHRREL